MEYNGLIQKFPINRPLTEGERRLQLKQKVRIDAEPLYQLSVIRMNSTYLEMTDKYYGWKGSLVTVASPIASFVAVVFGYMLFHLYFGDWSHQETPTPAWVGIGLVAMSLPLIALTVWIFFKDAYTYTHYPIRMNRKTRMVYVFRLDGSVLSVPWDQLFFCLSRCTSPGQWDIRGHVLDKDGVTVRETFSLTFWSFGPTAHAELRSYWEFVRRYMEDGAGAVNDRVHFCLPIEKRRESLKVGFEHMFATASGLPLPAVLFMAVIAALFLPGRWFAIRTSKIPVWPAEIESACRIDASDPYIKDGSMNPPDLR